MLKGRGLVRAGMAHAAHLSAEQIEEVKSKTPSHLVDAVINGNPTLGDGNVYQVSKSDIEYDYIKDSKGKYIDVPAHWRRLGGLDVGHNVTAYVSMAYDSDSDIIYITNEYIAQHQPPAVIASGIRHLKGDKHPIMIDPASRGKSQVDGRQLLVEYRKEKLDVRPAQNAVEAGIGAVWDRLSTGRLKVFRHCTRWFKEYENYMRDSEGKVRKKDDHLMDATRYGVMGIKLAKLMYGKADVVETWKNPYTY